MTEEPVYVARNLSSPPDTHTYTHIYIRTYIHIYIRTYVHVAGSPPTRVAAAARSGVLAETRRGVVPNSSRLVGEPSVWTAVSPCWSLPARDGTYRRGIPPSPVAQSVSRA